MVVIVNHLGDFSAGNVFVWANAAFFTIAEISKKSVDIGVDNVFGEPVSGGGVGQEIIVIMNSYGIDVGDFGRGGQENFEKFGAGDIFLRLESSVFVAFDHLAFDGFLKISEPPLITPVFQIGKAEGIAGEGGAAEIFVYKSGQGDLDNFSADNCLIWLEIGRPVGVFGDIVAAENPLLICVFDGGAVGMGGGDIAENSAVGRGDQGGGAGEGGEGGEKNCQEYRAKFHVDEIKNRHSLKR